LALAITLHARASGPNCVLTDARTLGESSMDWPDEEDALDIEPDVEPEKLTADPSRLISAAEAEAMVFTAAEIDALLLGWP
jgi:hypothetical protein